MLSFKGLRVVTHWNLCFQNAHRSFDQPFLPFHLDGHSLPISPSWTYSSYAQYLIHWCAAGTHPSRALISAGDQGFSNVVRRTFPPLCISPPGGNPWEQSFAEKAFMLTHDWRLLPPSRPVSTSGGCHVSHRFCNLGTNPRQAITRTTYN